MRAGQLFHRIAFDELVQVPDESGSSVQSYVERFRLWGGFGSITGKEAFAADQIAGTVDCKIVLRYSQWSTEIRSTWRAQRVDNAGQRVGPVYELYPPTETDFRHREMIILAKSGAIGG